jgi:hypothetical protein
VCAEENFKITDRSTDAQELSSACFFFLALLTCEQEFKNTAITQKVQ